MADITQSNIRHLSIDGTSCHMIKTGLDIYAVPIWVDIGDSYQDDGINLYSSRTTYLDLKGRSNGKYTLEFDGFLPQTLRVWFMDSISFDEFIVSADIYINNCKTTNLKFTVDGNDTHLTSYICYDMNELPIEYNLGIKDSFKQDTYGGITCVYLNDKGYLRLAYARSEGTLNRITYEYKFPIFMHDKFNAKVELTVSEIGGSLNRNCKFVFEARGWDIS